MRNTLETLESSISALRALSYMITTTIETGDDFSSDAGGIFVLLDTHLSKIDEVHHALREEAVERKRGAALQTLKEPTVPHETAGASTRDNSRAAEIAEALNLKRETVERVIAKLVGSDVPAAPEERRAVNE